MKRILLGSLAVVLAVGFSAFTANSTKVVKTNLYWYDASTGVAFSGNPQVEPSSSCTTAGTGCAIGFNNPQSDPLSETPQDTRAHN